MPASIYIMMPCIKLVLLRALQLTSTFFPILPASPNFNPAPALANVDRPEQAVAFKQELKGLSDSSINAALHANLPQLYKEGMFEHGSSALEAIHSTNPPLATQLLAAARYELLRRQVVELNNTTTSTSTPIVTEATTTSLATQNSLETSASTSNNAVVIPLVVSSTNSDGSVQTTVVPVLAPATASTPITLTSTDGAGAPVFLTTSVPAILATDSAGQVVTSAAPTTSGNVAVVIKTTNAQGSTVVTTITPAGGVVSSEVMITTTLPDGAKSTYTSFALVPAAAATQSGGPKLQGSGSRESPRLGLVGVMLFGVLIGGMML